MLLFKPRSVKCFAPGKIPAAYNLQGAAILVSFVMEMGVATLQTSAAPATLAVHSDQTAALEGDVARIRMC